MVPAMPPWGMWPALFLGLSLFYVLLCTAQKTRTAFLYGWLFGFGYFGAGLSWIGNALLVDGNEFAWVWPLAVAALPALLALFTAAACALSVRAADIKRPGGFILFIASLIASEWLRGHVFTGFPWNLYGYAWAGNLPMAQLASVGGIYWLTLLTTLWAALPGFLMVWTARPSFKILVLLVLALSMGTGFIYGTNRLENHPTVLRQDVIVRLVQPGISQEDKWNPAKGGDNFRKILSLSEAEKENESVATLIVWPETAMSAPLLNNPSAAAALKGVLSQYGQTVYLLSGILRFDTGPDGKERYYNSLSLFDKDLREVEAYNKSHLVPFGEYIPWQDLIPLSPFASFSGFTPGDGPQTSLIPGIGGYSPLVCYEIIFSGAVTSAGQDKPGFIVNVTNDAWYGDSAGPRQHFAQARFRAIEEGLPVIRSANTGISGIIDPLGRIVAREDLFASAGQNVVLPAPLERIPLYGRTKDAVFFATLAGFLVLAFCAIRHR